MKKSFVLVIINLLLFIADRLAKYLILKTPSEGIFLIKNVGIKLYLNEGLAFSLPIPNTINTVLAAAIIVILIGFLIKYFAINRCFFFAVALIIVGASSNLIDRIRFGAVIDFLSFYFWPAFNLADCYIIIGVIVFFVTLKKFYSLTASKTVTGDPTAKQDFPK